MNGIIRLAAAASLLFVTLTQAMNNQMTTYQQSYDWNSIYSRITSFAAAPDGKMDDSLIVLDYDANLVNDGRLVHSKLPERTEGFIRAGAKVFVLTARINNRKETTTEDIKRLGLSFSKDVFAENRNGIRIARGVRFHCNDTVWLDNTGYDVDATNGVIYCSCIRNSEMKEASATEGINAKDLLCDDLGVIFIPKGDLLVRLIENSELRSRPKKIVFVDDNLTNIRSMIRAIGYFNSEAAEPIPLLCIHNLTVWHAEQRDSYIDRLRQFYL
ncbi:MAG: DUF2608 domain-containing protein [Holosporaceae bacterium]|jgi:hypothetical protein|nr:DUF2608 domain-containing protein [Holosporaceae bacterium]